MWQHELVQELNAAKPKERRAIFEKYSRMTGKTVQHLYRVANAHGWSSGRKKRVDAGSCRSGLADAQVEYVAGMLEVTRRDKKGTIMPVERALQIAVDNGVIEPGQITAGGMSRILRERGVSARHLDAPGMRGEMRSLHPNHVHVFDASVCVQYYLPGGKLAVMRERDYYKNKTANLRKVKRRLMRYLMVDHFSGAFFVHYYHSAGESQENLYDFMIRAWQHKGNGKFPFRGVPFLLLMDRGSANTSKAIVTMLRRLGVEVPEGDPYQPQRQGAAEVTHNIVERWFESGLRIDPAQDMDTLNSNALDLITWHQASKCHSRHGMPRTQCWLQVTQEQLRELPDREILNDLSSYAEKPCTVGNGYKISFRGEEYVLSHVPGLYRNAKVTAVLRPWDWPVIDVLYKGERYEARPIHKLGAAEGAFNASAAVIGDEFRSVPETETEKARKRIRTAAFGQDNLNDRGEPRRGAVPFAGTKVFGHHADKLGDIAFMPKTGTAIEVEGTAADTHIPIMELFRRLRTAGVQVTADLNAELRERFGSSVSVRDAEETINELRDGRKPEDGRERQAAL